MKSYNFGTLFKNDRIKKLAEIALFMIIVLYSLTSAIENIYTFSGDYTYREVFNSLALKNGRSVLGSSMGLEIRRKFDIYKQPFKIAVDHVKKNLLSDGYKMIYDSSYFYIYKDLDTLRSEKNMDSLYTIFLPWAKRYVITKDKQTFLNARQEDEENKKKDSIDNEKDVLYTYKCDLYIVGTTKDTNYSKGFGISDKAQINFNARPFDVYMQEMFINAEYNEMKDSLNFRRHLIFYIRGDSLVSMIFGNEIRRENDKITSSTGAVTVSYESVYDGLLLQVSPEQYDLTYRLSGNQIKLRGIPDSMVVGSSVFHDINKIKSFAIFKKNLMTETVFYLASVIKISKVDSIMVKRALMIHNETNRGNVNDLRAAR